MTADTGLLAELSLPFDTDEVRWKPQAVSGSRALAIAYISARSVMDRLDRVLGPACWKDSYDVLPDGNVICTLALKIDGEWIAKQDVGGESEQPDEGDRRKSAFSDALKRAAVKWSIGRYLYRLPSQWVDFDPQKKQLVRTPTLPAWALPGQTPRAAQAPSAVPTCRQADNVGGPAPQESARITPEQIARLDKLLAAKGRRWPALRQWLDMPAHAALADVSPEDYARALKALGEEPDAPARKQ